MSGTGMYIESRFRDVHSQEQVYDARLERGDVHVLLWAPSTLRHGATETWLELNPQSKTPPRGFRVWGVTVQGLELSGY